MTPVEKAGYRAHAYSRGFKTHLADAMAVVEEGLRCCKNPYIAFSTGKDSLVVASLVWRQNKNIPAVYFDADCAFPETLALLDRMDRSRRKLIRWKCEPFLDTLARCGGPDSPGIEEETMRSTVYRPAVALMKEYGFDGVFLGLRADESSGRRKMANTTGAVHHCQYDGIYHINPILWWRYADVWAHIAAKNLDYNREYDAMDDIPFRERRISYWAGETNRTYGRWARLRLRHPSLWQSFVSRFPEVTRLT